MAEKGFGFVLGRKGEGREGLVEGKVRGGQAVGAALLVAHEIKAPETVGHLRTESSFCRLRLVLIDEGAK